MVRKTKINELIISRNPYKSYESTSIWNLVDSAISDLIENQDIKEMTSRKYIVGYIVKKILEHQEYVGVGEHGVPGKDKD
ncbi:MAG: hypothetical protein A2017_03670 [Lentisphaerae bacterium GWF2_44_16]|nr:MAG: hypothetical protein A2017_03670 [Lentisphaerae bacterium GWF2_44_16]